jgi:hypothetical protein
MGAGQTTAIVVNRQGDLEIHSVQDAPKQAMWCNHGILTIGSRTTYRFVAPNVPLDHLEAESDRPVLPTDDDRPHGTARRTSIGGRSDSTASSFYIVSDRVQQLVDTDISVVMKKRVRRGYSVANVGAPSHIERDHYLTQILSLFSTRRSVKNKAQGIRLSRIFGPGSIVRPVTLLYPTSS